MRTTLDDVCKSIADGDHQAPPKSADGIPFITISCLDSDGGQPDYAAAARVPLNYYDSLPDNRRAQPGDVLLSVVGSLGIPYLVKREDKFVFQRHIAILRPGKDLLPEYLYYLLKSPDSFHYIDSVAQGAAQRTFTLTQLRGMEVDIPSLDEQRRTVAALEPYDQLIENNRKQISLLEEAAQRLYKEWFVDLRFPGYEFTSIANGVPEGWTQVTLPEVADITYGYAFKSGQFNATGDGYPIVRIRNIPFGYSNDFTSEKADEKYFVNDGDLLVGMDGDFYINRWHGGKAWLVQRSCCIRAKEYYLTTYLEFALKMPLEAYQQGIVGATVRHLGKKHLDAIKILLPPKELCSAFEPVVKKRLVLNKEIDYVREARNRLIPQLISAEK